MAAQFVDSRYQQRQVRRESVIDPIDNQNQESVLAFEKFRELTLPRIGSYDEIQIPRARPICLPRPALIDTYWTACVSPHLRTRGSRRF